MRKVRTEDDLLAFLAVPGAEPLSVDQYRAHGTKESLLVPGHARCSIWSEHTPSLEGKPVGVIGHYAATDDQAARTLLDEASARLRRRGFKTVLGPMDGSTWRRYRFVTDPGTEPPFFLEPTNPPTFPAQWASAGFSPLASYVSTLAPQPTPPDPRTADAMVRAAAAGMSFRTLRTDDFAQELSKVYRLSLRSFAGNFLYSSIAKDEFAAQYSALRPFVDPRLALMAEQGNNLIGYSFALPDILEKQRGKPVATAILKTLAVDPTLAGQGLGALLTARTLAACWGSGYQRVIGALMHEDNRSRRISEHYAHVMRRYGIFRRTFEE